MINTTQRYTSIYRGVVIQNDDPSQSGRVKVFVPQVHASLLPLDDKDYDQSINFGVFGKNVNKQNKNQVDITNYMETLKQKVSWAQVLQPIVGETGNAKYNSSTGLGTPSDSNDYESSLAVSEDSELGGGAEEIYGSSNVTSVWSSGAAAGGVTASPSSGSFNYNKKHNSAKGTFAVPSVNTQVWVIFIDGNPNVPLVIGVSPSTSDWQQSVYPSAYPGSYENKGDTKSASTLDETMYRNATVQNSGSMTKITNNSTGNQSEHSIHITGTSQSVNNDGTVASFVTADSNKMVLGSKFSEIKGSDNQYTEGPSTVVIRGDRIKRVGSLNAAAAQAEKTTLKKIDQTKALFETQRTSGGTVYNSLEQSKSGSPGPCPECSGGKKRPTLTGDDTGDQFKSITQIDLKKLLPSFNIPEFPIKGKTQEDTSYPKPSECKTCGGTGKSRSSMGGDFPPEPKKAQIGKMYESAATDLAASEQSLGEGGSDITEITKNMFISVGCAFNDLDSVRIDPEGKFFNSGISISKDGPYEQRDPSPLIEPKHVDNLSGGTYTLVAGNNVSFIVGAGGIKFQTPGITEITGSIVNISGEQVNLSSANEVNLGGGGRLKLEANILSLKSTGGKVVVDCNLNVVSNLTTMGAGFFGGGVITTGITAPMVFQPTEELMEAWGITNDKEPKIVGYLRQGDKLKISSISGIVDSNQLPCSVKGVAEFTVSADMPIYSIGTSGAKPDKDAVRVYAHRHWFRNLPLTLTGKVSEMYELGGSATSGSSPTPPTPPKSGKTGPDADREFNSRKDYNKNKDDQYTSASYGDPQ